MNLDQIDEMYKDDQELLLGKGVLTMADMINSPRANMFSPELDQTDILGNPQRPLCFTGHENNVGKYSSAKYIAQDDFIVIDKICKYNDDSIYTLVIQHSDGKFDIIEKKPGVIISETHGYKMNNGVMDSFEEGDEVKKGTRLYASTSFDDDGNYRYGRNALAVYTSETDVTEDPIKISKSFAKSMFAYEYDNVTIPYNDNTLFLNSYGDNKHYKCFPDIGESIKDSTLVVSRIKNYAHAKYETKNCNLKKELATDEPYFIPFSSSRVVDINVKCNKDIDSIEETESNAQVLYYLRCCNNYTKKIYKALKKIVDSGEKYSDDLAYKYNMAKRMQNHKWRDSRGKIFNNIIIEFFVEKNVDIVVGSKLCGRYGDKGVVCMIVDDKDMPQLEDGRYVDMVLAILGVGGRLNPAQLVEVETNFCSDRIIQQSKDLYRNYRQRFDHIIKYVNIMNKKYGKRLKEYVNNLDDGECRAFFNELETEGLNMWMPPMKHAKAEQLFEVYDTFGIKPYKVYVKKFGRKIKVKHKMVVGKKYVLRLKHHPKSKLSIRSTGIVNSLSIPIKSNSVKTNKSIYSPTSVKFGNMEINNLLLSNDPLSLAKVTLMYSNSVEARNQIGESYDTSIEGVDNFDIPKEASNIIAQTYSAKLGSSGIGRRYTLEDGSVIEYR